ncbi:MAG: alpha/beta hydrolase, partial [Acetanaerobacterium sp.]
SWAHKVPTALPILMISGTMDPVGDYAKGTRLVYTRLHDAGVRDLSLRLYDNCRHEVLNELNRLDVYADILSWTDRRIHSAVQAGTASSDD